MSSSSDDEGELLADSTPLFGDRFSFNPKTATRPDQSHLGKHKELNREQKALVSRRFDNYFAAKRIYSDDFWKQSDKRDYDPKAWIKICFDG